MKNLRKILYNSELIIICTFIWCILKENIDLVTFIYGILISIFILTISRLYLMKKDYKIDYTLSPIKIILYSFILIFEIFKASINTIPDIVLNRHNTIIVDINTTLKNRMYSVILANSITMTPGTVVIDKKNQELKVVFLNCDSSNRNTKNLEMSIKGKYEILLGSRFFDNRRK